ncbi:MAG: hypothetical protein ACREBR_00630 [bacterium]
MKADNAKSEIGPMWRKTCRQIITKVIYTEPDNPQQNKAERRIQDVCRLGRIVLRKTEADQRCYLLQWICDVLGHCARRKLNWRSSIEISTGNTPDISAFRFAFWQTVHYYDPSAKFPTPNLRPGRFLGIARSHGDEFTYYIKDESKNTTSGRQRHTVLVRSIVRARDPNINDSLAEYAEDPDFNNKFPVNVPNEFHALRIFEEDDDDAQVVDDIADHADLGIETRSLRLRQNDPDTVADIASITHQKKRRERY